jgi:DnaJ family protein C protein 7
MNFFSKSPKKSSRKPPTPDADTARRSPSPPKKSPFKLHRDKDENFRARHGSSSSKSSPTRAQSFSPVFDPDSHPLNLPPDQLRRLSALANMSEQQSQPVLPTEMDVDSNEVNGATSSPADSTNDVNGTTNGKAPTPPEHKSPSPAPPPAPTEEEAEQWKMMGNKFYKNGEFKKAVEQYTKGECSTIPRLSELD